MAMAECASWLLPVAAPHRLVREGASSSSSRSSEHGLQSSRVAKLGRGGRGRGACRAGAKLERLSCREGFVAVRAMAPEEEKMTRRSPLDFPIEWDRPRPGRRADIFPQFSPMKTPLPPPLPADPPEEDEDEDEEKKEEEEESPEEPEKPDVSF